MKLEFWNTRYGPSKRVVQRDAKGHFVDNKSAKQLEKVSVKK